MDELPRIDPNWMRARRPAPRDDSIAIMSLVSAGILVAGFWMVGTEYELEADREMARRQSNEIAVVAHKRQVDALENEHTVLHYITEAQANRELEAANGSSINNAAIHHCVYGAGETYVLGRCRAPWVDVPNARFNSRQQDVADQVAMLAQADARLRAEERRFAQLTGQASGSGPSGYAVAPAISARQRCDMAKSQRDEAYRVVGNNRNYDFIRHWDDFVFQACQGV